MLFFCTLPAHFNILPHYNSNLQSYKMSYKIYVNCWNGMFTGEMILLSRLQAITRIAVSLNTKDEFHAKFQ